MVARCRRLIELADQVVASHQPAPPGVISPGSPDTELFRQWRPAALSFLIDVLGENHPYTREFERATDQGLWGRGPSLGGRGVLVAVLEDLEAGHLASVRQLIRAEVFTDFLEMAEHLHDNGYHHAAVSLTGAVLEDALRQIAEAASVKTNLRDDLAALNSKLVQAGAYSSIEAKRVALWTDLRNAADHGEWDKIDETSAGEMIRGVIGFLPAHLPT